MKTHSLLALYLTLSACPTFAGETFLTELNSQATTVKPTELVALSNQTLAAESTDWQPSAYSTSTTPTQQQLSGDDCVYITQDQLSTKHSQQKKNDSACYITQFPGQGIETHMQSNQDGEMSIGVKWEFE
ncbi:hypothetical protein ACED51_15710 [Photobacterium swingsii]|uniref:hypothetical protein n=1 Tax=Photobacterium swingsii TaxID=680026 RepID=UPI00352CF7BD